MDIVGCHCSITGGLKKSVQRALDYGANTMQIFVKSNRQWKSKDFKDKDVKEFKEKLKSSGLKKVIVHASYLINLGSVNETEQKSIDGLIDELKKCEQLGLEYLVLHPGAKMDTKEEDCLKRIAKNLDFVFSKVEGKSMILLENSAGQGSSVATTFEQIKKIYDACETKDRIGVCLDTCHMFAAGYDISTRKGYDFVMNKFEKVIGFDLLKAFHINNSKKELNCRVDRHENLKDGILPLDTFKWIIQDERFKDIPKVLETPNDDRYKDEIKLLREYSNKKRKNEDDQEESEKKKKIDLKESLVTKIE